MRKEAEALWWTIAVIWAAVMLGGGFAFRDQFSLAVGAALVAVAIEASWYAAAGFGVARQWMRGRWFVLFVSPLPAYFIYSCGGWTFNWRAFLLLLALSAAMAWWFAVLPAGGWTDGGFLLLVAVGLLTELAAFLYPPLSVKIKTDFIGRILWLRLAYWALLAIRDRGSMGFGFVPSRKDWIVGLRYSAYCTVAAAAVLWLVQPMKVKENLSWGLTPWVALGTFVAFLWVVALSEELFTRGVLLGDLTRGLKSEWSGVLVSSVFFGLVHLNYSNKFPNWRMVALAGVLGVFCGRAAQVAGSIRASMVTHALVVTVYRVFLTPR